MGNKKVALINTIKPGKIFGEIGLICDVVRTADIQTTGFTVVSYLNKL